MLSPSLAPASPPTWGAMTTPNSLKAAGHSLLLVGRRGRRTTQPGQTVNKEHAESRETQSQPPDFLHFCRSHKGGLSTKHQSEHAFPPQARVGGLLAKPLCPWPSPRGGPGRRAAVIFLTRGEHFYLVTLGSEITQVCLGAAASDTLEARAGEVIFLSWAHTPQPAATCLLPSGHCRRTVLPCQAYVLPAAGHRPQCHCRRANGGALMSAPLPLPGSPGRSFPEPPASGPEVLTSAKKLN